MNKRKCLNVHNTEDAPQKKQKKERRVILYRLKCAKTANGLSHYIIYGDVPADRALL